MQVAQCHPSDTIPAQQNQNFSAPALSLATAAPIISLMSGLAVDSGDDLVVGAPVQLSIPSASSPFYLNATAPPVGSNGSTGLLVNAASGLCLDATQGLSFPPPQPVSLMPCGGNRGAFQTFSSTVFPGSLALVNASVWGPQVRVAVRAAGKLLPGFLDES